MGVPFIVGRSFLSDVLRLRDPSKRGREFQHWRGMSAIWDLVDWLGGYPFEVAKPEEAFEFRRDRGLSLERRRTCGGGNGCNQFVFRRPSQP